MFLHAGVFAIGLQHLNPYEPYDLIGFNLIIFGIGILLISSLIFTLIFRLKTKGLNSYRFSLEEGGNNKNVMGCNCKD